MTIMFLPIYYSESNGSIDQPIRLLRMEDHKSIDLAHFTKFTYDLG